MFYCGDLVLIIKSDGSGHVANAPPALVIRGYLGRPNYLSSTPDNMRDKKMVYDILFNGSIERRIDGDWLIRLDDR